MWFASRFFTGEVSVSKIDAWYFNCARVSLELGGVWVVVVPNVPRLLIASARCSCCFCCCCCWCCSPVFSLDCLPPTFGSSLLRVHKLLLQPNLQGLRLSLRFACVGARADRQVREQQRLALRHIIHALQRDDGRLRDRLRCRRSVAVPSPGDASLTEAGPRSQPAPAVPEAAAEASEVWGALAPPARALSAP